MGVLDKVFGGEKGIVNVLAKTLGGTATIVFVGASTYDEATDLTLDGEEMVTVPFLPTNRKSVTSNLFPPTNGGFSMSGGLMLDSEMVAGTIPFTALNRIPTVDRDKIIYQGKTSIIKDIVVKSVGDTPISLEIIAK